MEILKETKTKDGNSILLWGGENCKNVLVVGVVHGDEPQGKFLIEEYLKKYPSSELEIPKMGEICASHLREDRGVNLLFIPCVNPDGMAKNTRTNSNGVDLNRNFPTKNWGKNEGENADCDDCTSSYFGGNSPASEIETKFLIEVIEEYKPEIILTLHAPYKVVNYDGPAQELAEKISDIIKYPTEGSIGYPTPGSFGTYAGVERGIKTITLELDEECSVEDLVVPVHKIFDLFCNDL